MFTCTVLLLLLLLLLLLWHTPRTLPFLPPPVSLARALPPTVVWTEFASLILQLMYEALYSLNTFYAPYFRMLPVSFASYRSQLTPEELQLAHNVTALRETLRLYPGEADFHFFIDNVLSKYPQLFGADTPAQRCVLLLFRLSCLSVFAFLCHSSHTVILSLPLCAHP